MSLFHTISHINLYTGKKQEMIRFFRDVLGMNPHPNQSEDDNWYGFHAGSNLQFAIEPITNRSAHTDFDCNMQNPILIQFAAETKEDLEAMNAHLKSKGVELLTESKEKSYGTITNFKDPDGNLYEILLRKESKKGL